MNCQTISAAAGLTILLLASTLNAQLPVRKAGEKRTLEILQGFDERLVKIDESLTKGKYKKALKDADLLRAEMNHRFISGSSIGRFLGLATVLRAIAEYHLGRKDDALWDWHIASQMYPDILNYKMTAYGDAGPFLKDNLISEKKPSSPDVPKEVKNIDSSQGASIDPPKKLRTPKPSIPAAKRGSDRVTVMVQVVVGVDGRVSQPRILESSGELTLIYASFEALRHWRFKPARLNGEPVPAYYNISINFKP